MTELPLCALVVAAGSGSRFGCDTPKQYCRLRGRSVLEWSLSALDKVPNLQHVAVVISPGDRQWPSVARELEGRRPRFRYDISSTDGGDTRAESVLAGLRHLLKQCDAASWVLVHDAARPLVRASDIGRLVDTVIANNADGGLLGSPAVDTVKQLLPESEDQQANHHRSRAIASTLDRARIWLAGTPQMFPLGQLLEAVGSASSGNSAVTDESSAMELAGFHPLMVEGRRDNIKLTHPEDLALIDYLMSADEDLYPPVATDNLKTGES